MFHNPVHKSPSSRSGKDCRIVGNSIIIITIMKIIIVIITILYYWNGKLLVDPHVCLLAGWLVGWFAGWSVCQNLLVRQGSSTSNAPIRAPCCVMLNSWEKIKKGGNSSLERKLRLKIFFYLIDAIFNRCPRFLFLLFNLCLFIFPMKANRLFLCLYLS